MRASASRRAWERVSGTVDRGVAAVERAEDFQDPRTAFGVELPVEAHGAVWAGADPQLPQSLGLVGGGGSIGVQVRQQPLADAGQRGGGEPAGGLSEGLLNLGSGLGVGGVRESAHHCDDHPHVGGPDRPSG